MTPPKPSAIQELAARALVRRYLSPLRGYNHVPDAESRLVEIVQQACVSVEHLVAVLETFDAEYPTIREIKETAFNLRDRFLPKGPSQREQWEKEYGPPDPEWSRNLLKTATGQVSAIDKKNQYKAERYNMRLQALKDSVFYSTPKGQAEIRAIVGERDRLASRKFWAEAIERNEKNYPAQVAAIRAGREPQFDQPRPEAIPMRPITAESFKGVEPMRVEKCATCGGTGRLAGDIYCDDCQTGRDLRKMETSYEGERRSCMNCPACNAKRLHEPSDWALHPYAGHGYQDNQGWTHLDLADRWRFPGGHYVPTSSAGAASLGISGEVTTVKAAPVGEKA